MFLKAILLLTLLVMACAATSRAASPRELVLGESVAPLVKSGAKRGTVRRRPALGGLLSVLAAMVLACASLVGAEGASDEVVRESAAVVQRDTRRGASTRRASAEPRPRLEKGGALRVSSFGRGGAGLHRVRCDFRAGYRSRAPPSA